MSLRRLFGPTLTPASDALERAIRTGFLIDDGPSGDAAREYYSWCSLSGRPAVIATPLYRGCARWRIWLILEPAGRSVRLTAEAVRALRAALRPEDGRVIVRDCGASLSIDDVPAHRVRLAAFRTAESAIQVCHDHGLWPPLGGPPGAGGDDGGCGGR